MLTSFKLSQYISQIDLDDLHDPESSAGITLEMKDRSRYFEGRAGDGNSGEPEAPVSFISFAILSIGLYYCISSQKLDMRSALLNLQEQVGPWELVLKSVKSWQIDSFFAIVHFYLAQTR